MSASEFTIRQPDVWYLHLRDDHMLAAVIGHSSYDFYRMPLNETCVKFTKASKSISFPRQFSVQNDHVTVFDPGFALYWNHETINAGEI